MDIPAEADQNRAETAGPLEDAAGPSTPRGQHLQRRMDSSQPRARGIAALSQRLPGQRLPVDPSIEQPNAADLTYGWHAVTSDEEEERQQQGQDTQEHRQREPGPGDQTSDDESSNDGDGEVPAAPAWAPAWPGAPRQGDIARQRQHNFDNGVQNSTLALLVARLGRWIWRLVDGNGDEEAAQDEAAQQSSQSGEGATSTDEQDNTQQNSESFICRICFDGPGSTDEGGENLGRLIAPCRCRGTMKFVHQGCLTRWRATSLRHNSVMACDQCGSPYKFRKSKFVGLATSRWLLLLVSCYLFISLVWVVGFTAEAVVRYLDSDSAEATLARGARKGQEARASQMPSTASRLYNWISFDSGDEVDDDTVYYTSRYDYRWAYSEPAAYATLIKAAIKYVGSGRVFDHVWSAARVDEESVQSQEPLMPSAVDSSDNLPEKSWWGALTDDWKYGRGGIWERQHSESEHADSVQKLSAVSPSSPLHSSHDDVSATSSEVSAHRPEASRERYDARSARLLEPGEKRKRPSAAKAPDQDLAKRTSLLSRMFERLFLQLSLGASLVGMSSFLSLLLGVSTWGPFHLNLGLGRGFARIARRRARTTGGSGSGGGRSEGEALVAVFLLILVLVGIIRALIAVYKVTNYLSKRMLVRVEDIIVDWSGEQDSDDAQQAEATTAPAHEPRGPRQRWNVHGLRQRLWRR